jgi:hypothetical protein
MLTLREQDSAPRRGWPPHRTRERSAGHQCSFSTNASAPSGPIVRSVTPPFRPEAAAQGHGRGCYIGAGSGGPPGGFERPALAVVGGTAGRSPADAARDHGPRPGLWRAAASDEEQLRSLTELLRDEGECDAAAHRVPVHASTIDMQVPEGDLLVSHVVGRGVHTGELLGIPATKKEVETEGIAVHRVRDGKIVEYSSVTDVARVLQQLGALPGPPD